MPVVAAQYRDEGTDRAGKLMMAAEGKAFWEVSLHSLPVRHWRKDVGDVSFRNVLQVMYHMARWNQRTHVYEAMQGPSRRKDRVAGLSN